MRARKVINWSQINHIRSLTTIHIVKISVGRRSLKRKIITIARSLLTYKKKRSKKLNNKRIDQNR